MERGIGLFKQRFHVLQGKIRLAPEKPTKLIMDCVILQNLCRKLNIELEEQEEEENEEDVDDRNGHEVLQPAVNVGAQEGTLFRENLTQNIIM